MHGFIELERVQKEAARGTNLCLVDEFAYDTLGMQQCRNPTLRNRKTQMIDREKMFQT